MTSETVTDMEYNPNRDLRFGYNVGQIDTKWNKLSQNLMKVVWKSIGFVPYGANLTHFTPKSDITENNTVVSWNKNNYI